MPLLDRTMPPPFRRPQQFALLVPEVFTARNGSKIFSIAGGQQDIIKLEFIFAAGRWQEKNIGTSLFTTYLLNKGTKALNSFEIASQLDHYGAHLEVNAGFDFVTTELYSLRSKFPYVLDLFLTIIRDAIFPEKELDQYRNIFLENLKVNQEKISYVASKILRESLFGNTHPYGYDIEASRAQGIHRDMLASFYQTHFQKPFVILSGKIDEQVQALVAEALASFESTDPSVSTEKISGQQRSPVYIEKPESVQSSLRLGKRIPGRHDKDYFDIQIVNHVLGGYFGSRLMNRLREDKGLTYGIHSSVVSLLRDTFLSIGTDVKKESREEAFSLIREELELLTSTPIGIEELETARNHFIGSFQNEINTPFAHAEKRKNILLNDLPHDYYNRLLNRVETIAADEIQQTAQKYFSPESFTEVSVG